MPHPARAHPTAPGLSRFVPSRLRPVLRRARVVASAGVLLTRPGFDLAWYRLLTGRPELSRSAAVLDYLLRGRHQGLTPAPLVDPDHHRTHPLLDRRLLGLATPRPHELVPWLEEEARPWAERRRLVRAPRRSRAYDRAAEAELMRRCSGRQPRREPASEVLVTVVLPVWNRAHVVGRAVASVVAQTMPDWELVVVDDGSTDDFAGALAPYADDPRVRVLVLAHGGVARARNAGAAAARGQYLAWLDSDDVFTPEHLRVLLLFLQDEGLRAAYDVMELREPGRAPEYRTLDGGREHLRAGNHVGQPALVYERALADEVGGYDESLPRGVDYDLVLRLADRVPLRMAPFVGCVVDNDPADVSRVSRSVPERWLEVVLKRHLVDWAALGAAAVSRPGGSVSVLVHADGDLLTAAVAVAELLVGAQPDDEATRDVQLVVVDDGSSVTGSAVLAWLARRRAPVTVVHSLRNRGRALGLDLALAAATGQVVVVPPSGARLRRGWLEPLVAALDDPCVPSAGDEVVAARFADLVRVRGFDPLVDDAALLADLRRRLVEPSGPQIRHPDAEAAQQAAQQRQ